MKNLPKRKWLMLLVAFGISLPVGLVTVLWLWITVALAQHCRTAQTSYSGDCVTAELQLLQDENRSFEDRNMAIWTLGQIADPRAHSVLAQYFTGVIPDREPLAEGLSQYEMKKALAHLENGAPLTSMLWRAVASL